MLIGQTVIAKTSPGTVLYGPWFPRQGNKFTAIVQVIRVSGISGTVNFRLDVETKNREASDASPTALGNGNRTGAGMLEVANTGALELIRYKFTITGNSGVEWVHFRSNPPLWLRN